MIQQQFILLKVVCLFSMRGKCVNCVLLIWGKDVISKINPYFLKIELPINLTYEFLKVIEKEGNFLFHTILIKRFYGIPEPEVIFKQRMLEHLTGSDL